MSSTMALPSPLPGAGLRRGSMPLPIKHQLVRASAVDELDSPPSSPEVASSAGVSPAVGRGPYKVMILGESGVGKSTLAAIFGGLKVGTHHEEEHTEDSYERRFFVDEEEVTLILYDIWDQGDPGGWMQESCLQTGDAFLVIFSVTDRRSFQRVTPILLRLRAGNPRTDPPIILVGNKSDLARSREVSREGSFFPSVKPEGTSFKIIFWLGYFNSCVNPIIYPCSSKEFKRAFIRLLKCQCRRRRRPIWRVYDNHWRATSINGSTFDSEREPRSRLSTINGSFILNSSSLDRSSSSKRRTLNLKRWRIFSPFQKPSTQLKEKMNSLSNKIRKGSVKGGPSASYKTEVESVSIGIPNEFMECIDYQMYDDLTDSESCELKETDI